MNALQAVPANIVTSANSAVDEEVKRAAEEAARREQEAREQAEREAEAKRAAVLKQSQTLLASIIFCEAGNQPYEGQVAVGAVVMNRVNSDIYPNSIEEVIYQPGQFGRCPQDGWTKSEVPAAIPIRPCRRRQTRCQEPTLWADACILTRAAMA